MSVPVDLNEVGVGEVDDALLSLVSAMLSGRYKEDLYLWHVSELCRDEPESAPELLGLIDRYYRLGRMPAEQYQKIKAKIEQAMGTRPPDDAPASESGGDEDVDSPEMDTRELRGIDATAQPPPAAVPLKPRAAPGRGSAASRSPGAAPAHPTAPPPRASAPGAPPLASA